MPRVKGATRLRAWLVREHYSQRELAAACQMHYTHINQILSGRRNPGLAIATRIEKLTKIPASIWVPPNESPAEEARRRKLRLARRRELRAAAKGGAKVGLKADNPTDGLAGAP